MEKNFSHWLKRVRDTHVVEINCSACLDGISQYVDLELTTGQAAERMPEVKHHLEQCGVCHEEYVTLRALASMEMEDQRPANEDLTARLKGHSE